MFDILNTNLRETAAGKKAFHPALILLQWQSWVKNTQHVLHHQLGTQPLIRSLRNIMMKKVVQ